MTQNSSPLLNVSALGDTFLKETRNQFNHLSRPAANKTSTTRTTTISIEEMRKKGRTHPHQIITPA
jgi:hypothetical protein